ncbi:MAG: hypothetical protein AB4050_04125 [Synechococcus sp.]
MKAFLSAPERHIRIGDPIIADLIYGWGNEHWSASDEYLVACMEHALAMNGPILECGSGLSTILVGAIAKQRGLAHWSLEHVPTWGNRVQFCLERYAVDSVTLFTAPLKCYGEFDWYAPPIEVMPTFDLVICDGPSARPQGGRFGLLPVMSDRLSADTVVLLDDAGREPEQMVAERWMAEFGGNAELLGHSKPFIQIAGMHLHPSSNSPLAPELMEPAISDLG